MTSLPMMPLLESFKWIGKTMSAKAQSILFARSTLTSIHLSSQGSIQQAFILNLASALTDLRQLRLGDVDMSTHVLDPLDPFTSLKRYVLIENLSRKGHLYYLYILLSIVKGMHPNQSLICTRELYWHRLSCGRCNSSATGIGWCSSLLLMYALRRWFPHFYITAWLGRYWQGRTSEYKEVA